MLGRRVRPRGEPARWSPPTMPNDPDPTDHPHGPTCTCTAHPWPSAMSVREARDAYLAENGFTVDAYTHPTTKGSLFGIAFSVPNPPSHQRAIRLHDLLHVATGYGTDHAGEAEISAWQARRGFTNAGAYVAAIVTFNLVVGALVAPGRLFAGFSRAGRGASIFDARYADVNMLDLNVGELRAMLGIPEAGLAEGTRGRHALAPL